ncbi:MAG: glycosyltransferase family 2 protein [Candidatus Gottesmanbacteria bacterium]|nr:glycosyltransferase family 2 protein [Candidatus Gottesmanbacteria bacterium]
MKKTSVDVSVVMPCLNEEAAVGECVRRAREGLVKLKGRGYTGEIIVVDNGSTDRSASIAKKAGARVLFQTIRGYGAAYQKGINAARGTYIVMGDSDGSYDFGAIPRFTRQLERGAEVVLGSRFAGHIMKGSMSTSHRFVGNPVLTAAINFYFGSRLTDSQTGFRACTKKAFTTLRLKSRGMEFASEMIAKAVAYNLKLTEIPITYHPRIGRSKLSPVKDTWRHITSILIYSPTYAFIIPGLILLTVGVVGTLALIGGPVYIGARMIDIHTMIMAVLLSSLGVQIILLGFFARVFTVKQLGLRGGALTDLLLRYISTERLFVIGMVCVIAAFAIIAGITVIWATHNFTQLAYERELIAGAGLGMIGSQLTLSSFIVGMLRE